MATEGSLPTGHQFIDTSHLPRSVETQQDGGMQDFLSSMMADYKQSKTEPPSRAAERHLNNPQYATHTDATGKLASITNSDGKAVLTFDKYKDGKPMEIDMSDGSRLFSLNGGVTYEYAAADRTLAPYGLTNLTIDNHGNLTFDKPTGEDARVTLAVDGTTVERANS